MTVPAVEPTIGREHAAAVLAALRATGLPVGDSQAPSDLLARYLVAYFDLGMRLPRRVGDQRGDFEFTVHVTAVGSDPEQTRWLADVARRALERLTVPGRTAVRVREHDADYTRRDDTANPPIWLQAHVYKIRTGPPD